MSTCPEAGVGWFPRAPEGSVVQADDREVRRRLRCHYREDGGSEPLRRVGRAAQAEPGALDQEEVGTLLRQPQPLRDGGIGIEMRAAFRKRIRGDVDDTHHPRAIQPQDAAVAVQLRRGVEHPIHQ